MFISTDFSSTRRALWILLEKEKEEKEDEDKEGERTGGGRKGGSKRGERKASMRLSVYWSSEASALSGPLSDEKRD